MDIRALVKEYGRPYSEMLGIDLRRRPELWFLAAILYGKPIREETATKTYRLFKQHGLTSAKKIAAAKWRHLVDILDEGGYTRYDFSTADRLHLVFGDLEKNYHGKLWNLYGQAKDSDDLERLLMGLGKGVGPVTVSIFLRDMRRVWKKAEPKPSPLVLSAMKRLKIRDLKAFSRTHGLDTIRLETALLRYGKSMRHGKHL